MINTPFIVGRNSLEQKERNQFGAVRMAGLKIVPPSTLYFLGDSECGSIVMIEQPGNGDYIFHVEI